MKNNSRAGCPKVLKSLTNTTCQKAEGSRVKSHVESCPKGVGLPGYTTLWQRKVMEVAV